ncbi:sugar ABC transporter permease [Spirochaetia bacterium]|nr:sugar ABC transporter permease [Spirochaetia bacterium]
MNKRVREGNSIVTALFYVLGAVVIFITLYPMYYVLILSISEPRAAMSMQVYIIPRGLNFDSYRVLFLDSQIWRAFLNTIMYTVITTLLMIITSVLGAFPLTFKGLKGRKFINTYLLITMFFSGGLIPGFLLILKLGLYDTPASLIIPACFSVWNIILTKSYFGTIPVTLREAARIDGANVYQLLLKIYLPISTPILAVIAIYTIVGVWNSWFAALVYLPHTDWQPLQLFLRRMLVVAQSPTDLLDAAAALEMANRRLSYAQLKYAMIIFTSLPVICTYPFLQKYFVRGIMLGSLKE